MIEYMVLTTAVGDNYVLTKVVYPCPEKYKGLRLPDGLHFIGTDGWALATVGWSGRLDTTTWIFRRKRGFWRWFWPKQPLLMARRSGDEPMPSLLQGLARELPNMDKTTK